MPLQVGIVGLSLVGKTTIFNALTGARASALAPAGNKPNVGIVKIPDERLHIIAKYIPTKEIVHATIQVVDVPGLVRGASTGEGLGNKFLAHVRDMDAILHVVRCFDSADVPHVEQTIDPVRDVDTVETELALADLEVVSGAMDKAERAAKSGEKEAVARAEILRRAYACLNEGRPVRELNLSSEQLRLIRSYGLITAKKTLFVANVGEDDIAGTSERVEALRRRAAAEQAPMVAICGNLEAEIAELDEKDRAEMLAAMGLKEPAQAVLARESCRLLGLHTFFTAGPKMVRSWTIPIGATAPQAAGAIHTDFERAFIRAEVYRVEDLAQYKTEAALRQHGKLRVEGRNYVVQEGDVIYFLTSA